jgi:Tfp pilus assembly protein PilX
MMPTPKRRAREAGSAYIVALLALVLLSMIGLAIVLITQSELQIGGNERVVSRIFYSADSGVSIATAKALVVGDYLPEGATVKFPDAPGGSAINSVNRVDLSPFFPIQEQPCNLCSINQLGEYSTKSYSAVTYAETATSTREAGTTQFGSKAISAQVGVQPWQTGISSYFAATEPTQLAKIKF